MPRLGLSGGLSGRLSGRVVPRQESFLAPVVANPFTHSVEFTACQRAKMLLLAVTLVPLRLILCLLLLLVSWPVALLAIVNLPRDGDDDDHDDEGTKSVRKPQPASRMSAVLHAVLCSLARVLVSVVGLAVRVRGRRAPPEEAPLLVVSPHSGFLDAAVAVASGLPSLVSRAENRRIPLVGALLSVTRPVLVCRSDAASRRATVDEIKRRAGSRGAYPQIMIFPEGTCTNRSCLITFKPGAFIPGAPVQPVLVRFPNELNTTVWTWQGPPAWKVLFWTMAQLYTIMEVEYLPVYRPDERERTDPALYADNVRQLMAKALCVPVTEHTFEDCRLMLSAGRMSLPLESALVEFSKLSRKLGLDVGSVERDLAEFGGAAGAGGRVDLSQFARLLRLPVSPVLRELFALYDRDGDGVVDFREYLIGLHVVSRPATADHVLRRAFQMFADKDAGGAPSEGGDAPVRGHVVRVDTLSVILRAALGVSDLDAGTMLRLLSGGPGGDVTVSYEEFMAFTARRPEYARLIATYLHLHEFDPSPGSAYPPTTTTTASASPSTSSRRGSLAVPPSPLCSDFSPWDDRDRDDDEVEKEVVVVEEVVEEEVEEVVDEVVDGDGRAKED